MAEADTKPRRMRTQLPEATVTIDRDPGDTWTSINNDLLNDERLPWEAVGLLCWMLSLPKDWEFRPSHVRKLRSIGRDKYRKTMRVLRDAGYVSQRIIRKPDGTILTNKTTVRSIPKPESVASPQQPENPAPGEIRRSVQPAAGKSGQLQKTKTLQTTHPSQTTQRRVVNFPGVTVMPGTPQADRWIEHWLSMPTPHDFRVSQLREGKPVKVQSEFP